MIMTNPEHVKILSANVDEWNSMREVKGFVPDLEGAVLADLKLQGVDFRGVNLRRADLERANLRRALLDGADLQGSYLTGADLTEASLRGCILRDVQAPSAYFHEADLGGAKLVSAYMWGAHFVGASLAHAELRYADLTKSNLRRCNLEGANIDDAVLIEADLDDAILKNADLRHSDLTGASFNEAALENCDVRKARGLELDETMIRGAKFSPRASDRWSVLRRNYTGPMFIFHIMFLVAFLIPYVARSLIWSSVNKAQEMHGRVALELSSAAEATKVRDEIAVADFNDRLADIWEERQLNPFAFGVVEDLILQSPVQIRSDFMSSVVARFDQVSPCLQSNCDPPRSVFLVMLGAGGGAIKVVLAVSLLLYNISRAILTRQVSLLRDAEERSGYSPAKREYDWMYRLHHPVMLFFFWVAILALIVHGWEFLVETEVILPAQRG